MKIDNWQKREIFGLLFWGFTGLVVMFTIMSLAGCSSTKYIPVETIKTVYKTRDSIRVDSIYQRDSIYMLIKGDTVYKYKDRYLYKYLYLNRTDTVIKTDSIQVSYPVEKHLTKWQAMKIELGGWAFGIIIALILIIIGRLIFCLIGK